MEKDTKELKDKNQLPPKKGLGLFRKKDKKKDIMVEDDIQTPFRTILNTFISNKVAMTAFFIFLGIFLLVLIGPLFNPLDLSYVETTQANIAPGFDILPLPDGLKNVKALSVGSTFSVAVDDNGKIFVWGKSNISKKVDIRKIPKEVKKEGKNIVKLACGTDHVIALTEDGKVLGWGNNRLKQAKAPAELMGTKIVDIAASDQVSYAIDEDGDTYAWGNMGVNDYKEGHEYQGNIAKIAPNPNTACAITKDGKVVHLGAQESGLSKIPEINEKVVDLASSYNTFVAVGESGKIYMWGNPSTTGEWEVPENIEGNVKNIYGQRYSYVAKLKDDTIQEWGSNSLGQLDVPADLRDKKVDEVYTGFYQTHIKDQSGKMHSYGHKGYLLGTDDLGRDIWNRILNGGRKSMTIGAIAVIISTIIGVIVGGISGFVGGWVDNVLQRVAEMIGSLPFLPFAMILSALVGQTMTADQKIFMIMIILGLLSWTGLQRLVRAQVLSIREQEYVVAARSLGIKEKNIIFKHILPNTISIIIVNATLSFASSMLTEASLSFLGFGVPAPYPTWGNMLNGANNSIIIQRYWWRWVFPSIILGVCVICINLIGDGLRDAIDPKSAER